LTTPVSPLTTSLPAAPSPPLSLVDVAGLAAFRMAVQHHSGCARPEPGFAGMLHELRDYQRTHSVTEQVECSSDIMATLAGPIPWLFKAICSRTPFGPAILAWFTCVFGPFLVGEMSLTPRAPDDMRSGGVRITRCKVLAESGCAGLCLNMCKLPTERMFAEKWGVPLYMQPDFETHECNLAFGVPPLPVDSDPAVPQGCLSSCPLQLSHRAAQTPAIAAPRPADASDDSSLRRPSAAPPTAPIGAPETP